KRLTHFKKMIMSQKQYFSFKLVLFIALMMGGMIGCSVQKNRTARLAFEKQSWIRINQLGYTPDGIKVAVLGSKVEGTVESFQLINAHSKQEVFNSPAGKAFGKYGPFN